MIINKIKKLKEEIKRIEEVQKLNEKFRKSSKKDQRILIAKDVINQLKLGKFIAKADNGYFDILNKEFYDSKKQLQETILEKDIKCDICGIGGVFASCVRINNKFEEKEIVNGSQQKIIQKHLSKYFSIKQLEMIEAAFEEHNCTDDDTYTRRDIEKSIDFGNKYRNDTDRLIKIMENIIKNKGIFIP